MKVSKFSDSQIASILKQAESGVPVPALCREHGISSATFYKWRSKYAGMDANLMSRLKALEAENTRLKNSMPNPSCTPTSSRSALQKSKRVIS